MDEYNELPTKNFRLIFTTSYYFYPTSIDRLNYEFLFKIKEIKLITNNAISMYYYIRGRLSDKKVKTNSSEAIMYEFVWVDNKLKKNIVK